MIFTQLKLILLVYLYITNIGGASIAYRTIDFSKIQIHKDEFNSSSTVILLRTRNVKRGKITHPHDQIDRCCRSSGWEEDVHQLRFGGNDNIGRIPCDISKTSFLRDYVMKRKSVILNNCADTWKAKDWNFKGKL